MEWKPTFYGVSHATSSEEMAAKQILGGNHVTDPREASVNESKSDTWTWHGSKGPPGTQTDSKLGMHLEPTMGPTHQSLGENTTRHVACRDQPILGSAEPTFGRIIPTFHVSLPDWFLSVCWRWILVLQRYSLHFGLSSIIELTRH
jgi:hypothetical protein